VFATLAFTDGPQLPAAAAELLDALAGRAGFQGGRLGRSFEEPYGWLLVTCWRGLGDYRRALGAAPVRMATGALLANLTADSAAYELVAERPPPTA
jgi:hypothetical protein